MKEKFEGLVEHLFKGSIDLPQAVEILERSMIARALEAHAGNQSAASKQLGIHRNTLQRKMAEFGMGSGRVGSRRRKPVVRDARTRRPKTGVA